MTETARSANGAIKKVISVGDLIHSIHVRLKSISRLSGFLIRGELSNVRTSNGNCYFVLKDENGAMRCSMWRSAYARLGMPLQDGMAVLVECDINIYEKNGDLQLNVSNVIPEGEGALALRYELLRKQLYEQGYFAPAHKKLRPGWIYSAGVVTGARTAALEDVLKTLRTRWPMLDVRIYPATVQGESAPAQICARLKEADQNGHDAILLVRGGGSLEDLFCFNDPSIVQTLHEMKTYTVTGIGHEIDTTLADLEADHRAVTPTAAAQWITPDQNQVRAQIDEYAKQISGAMKSSFTNAASLLMNVQNSYPLSNPADWLERRRQNWSVLDHSLRTYAVTALKDAKSSLQMTSNALQEAIRFYDSSLMVRLHNLQSALSQGSPLGRILQQRQVLSALILGLVRNAQQDLQLSARALQSLSLQLSTLSPNRKADQAALRLAGLQNQLRLNADSLFCSWKNELSLLDNGLQLLQPDTRIQAERTACSTLRKTLVDQMQALLQAAQNNLQQQDHLLHAYSPLCILEKGYGVMFVDGKPLQNNAGIQPGTQMQILYQHGCLDAAIQTVHPGTPEQLLDLLEPTPKQES